MSTYHEECLDLHQAFCARNIFIRTSPAFLFTTEPVGLAHHIELHATTSRWGKQSPWMLEEDVLELSYLSFILHSYFLPPWRSHGDCLPFPTPYSAIFSQLRSSPSSPSSHPQRPSSSPLSLPYRPTHMRHRYYHLHSRDRILRERRRDRSALHLSKPSRTS